MKYIATWSFKPYLNNQSNGWLSDEYMLACAVRSCEKINELFGKPTIYTDTLGAEIFQSIGIEADFEIVLDNVFDDIDSGLWAFPKLEVMKRQSEPYLHFDLDFIFHKLPPQGWFEGDVGCQWLELPRDNIGAYNIPTLAHLYDLPPMFRSPYVQITKAPCLGVLLMNNMDLNNQWLDEVFTLIDNNRILLSNESTQLHSCVVEQQSLGLAAAHYKVTTLSNLIHDVTPPHSDVYTHYMGPVWKASEDNPALNELRSQQLDPYITSAVKKAADILRSLR